MSAYYDYQKILDTVSQRDEELVRTLFPEAKKCSGGWRTGGANHEKGRSFLISNKTSRSCAYLDFADDSVRGNAISLVALAKGMSYKEAAEWLANFLGVEKEERMQIRKERPTPKFKNDIVELNQRSIMYAKGRGISEATLIANNVKSTATHIVFPHYDEDGKVCMTKYWSCDDKKQIFTNEDPIHTLFGKQAIDPVRSGGVIIITEGQWDALSWQEIGYNAVSIPSGVSNDQWITEDWVWLNQFDTIYLDFDKDRQGQEAEAKARVRLGSERCKIIKHSFKDANEALKKGEKDALIEAFKTARDAPIERLVDMAAMKDSVKDFMSNKNVSNGTPFFLEDLSFHFRPHELTFWFGLTSHGKSTVLSQQVVYATSQGKTVMVASFEQQPAMTFGGALLQYTGDEDICKRSYFDEAYKALSERMLFFDSMKKVGAKELLETMIRAHKQLGVNEFVIDNVMTLDVDRGDMTAQSDTADQFRVFVSEYPVHVHLVGHPRKPKEDGTTKPPSIYEARGAAEWVDMANNVIVVFRDVGKAEKLSQMYDDKLPYEDIAAFDNSMPDGKVIVRKQRLTGKLPLTSYRFDGRTNRAYREEADLMPYWWPQEPSSSGEDTQTFEQPF